jgi:Holliday junction resolvasome RuvABC endonuclease subunit
MSRIVDRMRRNPLEGVLLLLAIAALACAMVTTARVALTGDRMSDLTFAGTTDALSRALATNGPERFGRLERALIVVGSDTAIADTILVTADSVAQPAVAKGGFIHDQVALYNDHAIRQAVLGLGRASRANVESPSLLRTVFTDDGTRRLSDQVSAYAIAIRSPYAEGTWREVRTTDWRSSPGLLGFDGEVALSSDLPAGEAPASLNGRQCNVQSQALQRLMYCRSTLGAEVGRFYDFGFEIGPSANGARLLNAFAYRQRNVWLNGRSQSFGKRQVNGGDVLELQALGPFVLSSADWGTLAAEQWINGRRTFANPRIGTVSFFARAGRSTPSASASAAIPLVLSFDAALAADIDQAAQRFIEASDGMIARMAVVIVDARSGEVKAIAEPARSWEDAALLSFEPLLVGSLVKPIMAAALLTRQPELADLRLSYAGDTVRQVAGIPLRKGFANAANGCGAEIGFVDFLRCSSNQYAAELLVRSLKTDGFAPSGAAGPVIPRSRLETSAMATGLAEAFDVDAYAQRTRGRLALYWNPDSAAVAGAGAATTDRTLIPWESRPWIVFPDSSGTRVDLLARYAFGGWENRWTLLGIAQAFARIATDRNVQANFLHRAGDTNGNRFPMAGPLVTEAFAHVRGALRQVGVSGTAGGLSPKLQDAVKQPIVVLSKTGTLNESTAAGKLKSLAIAMGLPAVDSAAGSAPPLRCGLVAVTYFEFADQWNRGGGRAALPRVHLDFAEGPFAGVMSRHWMRVSGCAPPVRRPDAPLPSMVRK